MNFKKFDVLFSVTYIFENLTTVNIDYNGNRSLQTFSIAFPSTTKSILQSSGDSNYFCL